VGAEHRVHGVDEQVGEERIASIGEVEAVEAEQAAEERDRQGLTATVILRKVAR